MVHEVFLIFTLPTSLIWFSYSTSSFTLLTSYRMFFALPTTRHFLSSFLCQEIFFSDFYIINSLSFVIFFPDAYLLNRKVSRASFIKDGPLLFSLIYFLKFINTANSITYLLSRFKLHKNLRKNE